MHEAKYSQNMTLEINLSRDTKQSPLKSIAMIRFQLEQLGARNAHHEFEHLCRHLSRETICSNILPATGPVSSGGDQGRDYETFTTFINLPRSDGIYFGGRSDSKQLIFACSLTNKAKLKSKIESDVKTICHGCNPDIVYFFSNQDISVALRHTLQIWSEEAHNIKLEIIDAQALSEQLSAPNTFWIAEEFLDIPSELMARPIVSENNDYEKARQKWIVDGQDPVNYADFVDIKNNLRKATFDDALKSDLSAWQRTIEIFIHSEFKEDLQRRATYEICVSELRGKHNLTPRLDLVENYFKNWGTLQDNNAIRDATVLLSYSSTAAIIGEFDIEKDKLHSWTISTIKHINAKLASTNNDNVKVELLMIRAHSACLQFKNGTEPSYNIDEIFRWWLKLIKSVKKSPLFPIEPFADLLTDMAPYFGEHPEYFSLTSQLDDLLIERTKGYIVADKCRDRAIKFMDAGKLILAINELHRTKIAWFNGDMIKGSLLSSFILSKIYLDMGLNYAAKYHVMSAMLIIDSIENDTTSKLIEPALFQLGRCLYSSGDWIGYSEFFPLMLIAHYEQTQDPDNWQNHPNIQEAVFHFWVMHALAKASNNAELIELVETPLKALSIPESLLEDILHPPISTEKYETMTTEEIMEHCSEELNGPPFADCESTRRYHWRALGITWLIKTTNSFAYICYVEEFIAVLQIATVSFAKIDLGLLPTTVELDVSVTNSLRFSCDNSPNNERLAFKVVLPRIQNTNTHQMQEMQTTILSTVTGLLIWCSSLPEQEINAKLEAAFEADLYGKAFLLHPYSELFKKFLSHDNFKVLRKRTQYPFDIDKFYPKQHDELTWINIPGWGYTKTKAVEFLKNRYEATIIPIRKTLNKLKTSERFKVWVTERRSSGLLDWQILLIISNIVINHRSGDIKQTDDLSQYQERMINLWKSEETDDDSANFPEDKLYSDYQNTIKTLTLSNAKTWGLVTRTETPDFAAWLHLLNVRYFQSTDDIPHKNIP